MLTKFGSLENYGHILILRWPYIGFFINRKLSESAHGGEGIQPEKNIFFVDMGRI